MTDQTSCGSCHGARAPPGSPTTASPRVADRPPAHPGPPPTTLPAPELASAPMVRNPPAGSSAAAVGSPHAGRHPTLAEARARPYKCPVGPQRANARVAPASPRQLAPSCPASAAASLPRMPPPTARSQLAQRLCAPRRARCAARHARSEGVAASEQQSCPRAATGRRRPCRAAESAVQCRRCEHRRRGAPRRPWSRRAPVGARPPQQHASHTRPTRSGSVAPSRARLLGRRRSPPRARARSPSSRCRGCRRRPPASGTSRSTRAASCELRGHARSERQATTRAEGHEGQGVGGCGRAYRRRYRELNR
jgi:hypothetical protein